MALKPDDPTGLVHVDRVNDLANPSLQNYIDAVSDYVSNRRMVGADSAKASQIRLSAALGRFLRDELHKKLPAINAHAGEHQVAGALRTMQSDVTDSAESDGLRLAIEIKPVNLAVGRAIWNRFGDIRTFAVNMHLKFPFAVVGGVLSIPTYEEATSKKTGPYKRDTRHLINRAVLRLARAGGRLKESDAPHLLEGVWVLVYDPDTATLDPNVPPKDNHLRLNEFIDDLAAAYDARFTG